MKKCFLKGNTQMANQHKKWCSTLQVIREMLIKNNLSTNSQLHEWLK